MGDNINGPSLIRVPSWVPEPLGRYYLYFANHGGTYIRLADADEIGGPYRIHTPGVLDLSASYFGHHIASPDVRVRSDRREIWMYYHGYTQGVSGQFTRLAVSADGLNFTAREPILGTFYWRTFEWGGWHYALVMPGQFVRSRDGMTGYQSGPTLFTPDMRHAALRLRGDVLEVYYSNAGDCPESILRSKIQLSDDWMSWRATKPEMVLRPELGWEGADEPLVPSKRGAVHGPANQLRDPCIYEEGGRTYLLYAVAGESGIAIAEIIDA